MAFFFHEGFHCLVDRPQNPLMQKTDSSALNAKFEDVYAELKRLAAAQLRHERTDHTLSATGLVHEAYLKLARSHVSWQDRAHFLGLAARAMRQILVDHARIRNAEKRGGSWIKLTLTGVMPSIEQADDDGIDVIKLNDALIELEALDARQARVVELRYFAGLSIEDTADAMNLSAATVKREWSVAMLYLKTAVHA